MKTESKVQRCEKSLDSQWWWLKPRRKSHSISWCLYTIECTKG